ncbi:MAG: SDR family oxidoreductase [Saprospiraceae bacterium]|jgi:nucleoside-diphosphate-sugar epimerase|nr:SDR family oxidoreductase [Saprospiraceae bacterium]
MKNILVTGGAGFIGSNLVEDLLENGYHVRILDNYSSGSRDNLVQFRSFSNFDAFEGDIRDLHSCMQACNDMDAVIHLAALGSVPRSIAEPINSNENNISGTLNMLVAAKEKNIQRFVCASSSSVYGNKTTDLTVKPRSENDFPNPVSPYAITKYGLELYARQFYHLYGLKTIAIRFFNVFGKRQNPESQYAAVIPIFITKLLKGERPTIYGDGSTSRDFTHVSNVIEGCKLALNADERAYGEVFNLACGSSITLNELYYAIQKELGSDIEPNYAEERKGDIKFSFADITKANELLGYTMKTSFESGIKKTVQWYKDQFKYNA